MFRRDEKNGKNFTLGIVFEKKIEERLVISPEDLAFVYEIDVELRRK